MKLSVCQVGSWNGPTRARELLRPPLELLEPKVKRARPGIIEPEDCPWPTTAELKAAGSFIAKWQSLRDRTVVSKVFFTPVPTLQYAFFEMDQDLPLAREHTFWKADPDAGRQIVSMEKNEAYEVLRQEGMPWPFW